MDAPKCKLCGERHWGTCADHGAKGYLSSHVAPHSEPRIAQQPERRPTTPETAGATSALRSNQSTASRKDAKSEAPADGSADSRKAKPNKAAAHPRENDALAVGTQAQPVDTSLSSAAEDDSQTPLPIIGKRRGRPQTITDRKAYKAQKERERRAKPPAKLDHNAG